MDINKDKIYKKQIKLELILIKKIFVLQIICTSTHNVSFAQVRGSVPVYWSQPGYKYRPPPRLDRGTQEKLMVLNRKDTRDGHVHA